MGCSLPVSSVCGILQTRTLEWVAISFSRGSSWPRDRTQVSLIAGRFFTVWATRQDTHTVLPSNFYRWGYSSLEREGVSQVLVSLGWHTRIPQPAWRNQEKFPVSRFWRLASSRPRFWLIEFLVRALILVSIQLPSHCVLTWPVCVCVCVQRRGKAGGSLVSFLIRMLISEAI